MFMGVGLGPDSYAIIEQGPHRPDSLPKPMERRAIIEEAAGVTKFKPKSASRKPSWNPPSSISRASTTSWWKSKSSLAR